MRFPLSSCALVLVTSLVTAQSASPAPAPAPAPTASPSAELAAAKARVAGALQKGSQLTDTAFVMKWGPDKKKKGGDDAFARMMGASFSGETKGSWHRELTHVAYEGENDDELLLAGGRMLAKDGTNDWRLRAGRFADGNTVSFVPDVPRLLQQLATWDLAITNRTVGSRDDRPIEIVTVALNAEQVTEAIWAGLLPEAIVTATGVSGARVFRMAAGVGGGAAARPPATAPESTIDLAIHLDPATNVIHQLHFRGWTKENAGGGAGGIFVVAGAGGARVAGAGGDDEEEDEEKDAKAGADKAAPLVYENGLPVRPRKKTSVTDVVVTLSQHGTQQAPALTDAMKKLLGR